ncbi:hypothetical protein LCGC14_2136150 [marine sediment metagenome]|uniref:Uncharacterized protein n=1 Tax=marine sediment metagenome TaxID=412755 RepID=A0A0F9GW55_9ZZZZ
MPRFPPSSRVCARYPFGVGLCSAVLLAWVLTGCGGAADGPELAVQVHSGQGKVVVDWEFRNTTGRPLWVPTGMSFEGHYTYSFPLVYVVPPGDLMLLSGDFRLNDRRNASLRINHLEDRRLAVRRVSPGESYGGRTVIPCPYEVLTVPQLDGDLFDDSPEQEDRDFHCLLANPHHSAGMRYGNRVLVVKEASAIQVAFQYWVAKPARGGWDSASGTGTASRIYLADFIIDGEIYDPPTCHDPISRYVFSQRVRVPVRLKTPVRLYTWGPTQGTGF